MPSGEAMSTVSGQPRTTSDRERRLNAEDSKSLDMSASQGALMSSSANSRLHCSMCKKLFMPFSPNTCKDENDNIVHIACYVKSEKRPLVEKASGYQFAALAAMSAADEQKGCASWHVPDQKPRRWLKEKSVLPTRSIDGDAKNSHSPWVKSC
jgi:hypothetical protein